MAHLSTTGYPAPVGTTGETTFPAAELDRRFYAFAIDRLVAWTIDAAGVYAAYVLLIEPGDTWAGVAVIVGVVLLVGLVFALLLGLRGTSPGKAALGLRVVGAGTGEPVGVRRALVRTFVLGVAALPTFGLGIATLAWTAVMDPGGQRRGWHDRLSDAVVVDVRPIPDEEAAPTPAPRAIVNLTAMRLVPPPPLPEVATPVRPPRHALPSEPATPPATPPAPALGPRPSGPPPSAPPPVSVPAPSASVPTVRWRVGFDTGEGFVVEGLTLVGRSPEARPGEPVHHLLPLRSSDMSLSKTHAQFQVVPDGALVVMDRGSTNGSVLIRRGVPRDLVAGRPATLLDGDLVRFGDRTMTVLREG